MNDDLHPKIYLYRRIVEAKLYMDTHYHEKIDLPDISDQACFSKYHFLRLFRQVYGKSPHRYLTEVRIQQAKKLLEAGTSISQTCFEVGFESIPSFIGLFKRYVGISPGTYADQCRLESMEQKETPLKFVPNCFAENFGWTE